MASYLREDPAQSYQFTPYQEDYSGILKTLQVKEAYWRQGVQKVKSAAEQAAGLSLTYGKNKDQLNNFIQEADGKLKKILASDVSVYDNATQALSLYKPLYDPVNNREMLTDHAITEHYEEQFKLMQSDMTKDNGKNFSQTNAQYLLMSKQDYLDNEKRGNGAVDFKGKEKSYSHYYDYKDEFSKILKECKPNELTATGVSDANGLYMMTNSNKSLESSKLNSCLQASMSDKAREQIGIEAYVRYGKNMPAVGARYVEMGDNDIKASLFEKDRNLESIVKRTKDLEKAATPQEKELIQQDIDTLSHMNSTIDEDIKGTKENISKILKGDVDFVEKNYDNLTKRIGLRETTGNFANAFSYMNTEKTLKENKVAMMLAKFNQDRALQNDQQNFDESQTIYKENQANARLMFKEQGENKRAGLTEDGFIPLKEEDLVPDESEVVLVNKDYEKSIEQSKIAKSKIEDYNKLEFDQLKTFLLNNLQDKEKEKMKGFENSPYSEERYKLYKTMANNLATTAEYKMKPNFVAGLDKMQKEFNQSRSSYNSQAKRGDLVNFNLKDKLENDPDFKKEVTVKFEDGSTKKMKAIDYYNTKETKENTYERRFDPEADLDAAYSAGLVTKEELSAPPEAKTYKVKTNYLNGKKVSSVEGMPDISKKISEAYRPYMEKNKYAEASELSKAQSDKIKEEIRSNLSAMGLGIDLKDIILTKFDNGKIGFNIIDNDSNSKQATINGALESNQNFKIQSDKNKRWGSYVLDRDMSEITGLTLEDQAQAQLDKGLSKLLTSTVKEGKLSVLYGDGEDIRIIGSKHGNTPTFHLSIKQKDGSYSNPLGTGFSSDEVVTKYNNILNNYKLYNNQ